MLHNSLRLFTQTLTTLILQDADIEESGIKCFSEALQNNKVNCDYPFNFFLNRIFLPFTKTLTTLDLLGNHIHDEGAQYLADALRNNTVSLILY